MAESIYNYSNQTALAAIYLVIKWMFTSIICNQTAGYGENLDNEGPHSATPTDTDFKVKQSKRSLIRIIHKNRINGIFKEKSKISKQIMVPNGILWKIYATWYWLIVEQRMNSIFAGEHHFTHRSEEKEVI